MIRLKDKHGGEWDEWDESLRIREFPKAFHDYRKDEMKPTDELRPIKKPKKKKSDLADVTPEEKSEFKRLDKIVRKGVEAFMECGKALIEIQEKKLWRAGAWETWEDYCMQVAGLSKSYASRIINASRVANRLASDTTPLGDGLKVIGYAVVVAAVLAVLGKLVK